MPTCDLELPPECHIWFARSSACVGPAYKGLESAAISEARQESFIQLSRWLQQRPTVLVDIRGSCAKDEISAKQAWALSVARAKHAVNFLINMCGLEKRRCRVSTPTDGGHQGVEVRALFQIGDRVTFGENSVRLAESSVLDHVAGEIRKGLQRRVLVEVELGSAGDKALARKRCTALSQSLLALGLPCRRATVRIHAPGIDSTTPCTGEGAENVASFYLYEEMPPAKGDH